MPNSYEHYFDDKAYFISSNQSYSLADHASLMDHHCSTIAMIVCKIREESLAGAKFLSNVILGE
jgi:hypothetical protein